MVFPIGDDNRDRRSFPVVTVTLIAMNIFVFVVFQGMGANEAFTMAYSTVPAEITSGKDLVTEDKVVRGTSVDGQPIEGIQPGLNRTPIPVYLTLLTAVFMHGGVAHLLGNMWFLWIFGDNIEDDMGRLRYTIFYLLCGLLASLAHVLTNMSSQIPSLGASGAISGVMGAYLILHTQRRVRVILLRIITDVPGWVAVGIWFAFQVINGVFLMSSEEVGVAYGAHIGGFLAGMALAKPFMIGRRVVRQSPRDEPDVSYGRW
jgi:membrane associated rhomboid family serine protease